ncbi:beta-glucosidase B [Corynespora cassiicola Philippines]|uniref:beta-glucosidase n=1 Tax=Corynespora cassiicola Philippines TaxID=1448308 RepID=A0A2T2N5H9_CORCC|nr:beta-glucosidase B [Corynespora cassiicola Philippines]
MEISTLLDSLTLEEKCILLSGQNMWETASIPRLGIPSLKMTDGPAGVRGSRWVDGTPTTQIPCGISLAATFNPELMERIGQLLGFEAKCKNAQVLLAPTMNMSRSPFGGRNFENFGEDPYLTGRMATGFIKGVQEQGVAACMKHFVLNEQETRRFNMDEHIDERTLREVYLKPFMMALRADPWTAMTSYPKINGEHADTSQFLVKEILRKEWRYEGLVMSDWGGLNDTVKSILASTDLEMPGPAIRYGNALMKAVARGDVSENRDINPAVERLFHLLAKTGQLAGGQPRSGTSDVTPEAPEGESDNPEARRLVREAASQGIVLLKNSGILPLQSGQIRKLAVIGPNTKYPTTGGSGSAAVNPYYISTPLKAISQLARQRNSQVEILYERGIFTHKQPPLVGDCLTVHETGLPGLQVDFYDSDNFEGDIVATSHWNDSFLFFMSDGDVPKSLQGKTYSYKAHGILKPTVSGDYDLSFSSTGKAKLFIDDKILIDNTDWTEIGENFMNAGSIEKLASMYLEGGKMYKLRVDNVATPPPIRPLDNTLFGTLSGIRVGMFLQHDEDAMLDRAVSAAKDADVVVLVVGHNNDTEREGSDRTSLSLPKKTDQLVEKVCAVNSKVIVVTQSACAIAMPWVKLPAAIVHAWYQGQECGNALADVLFGVANPSGKLPITFPKRIEDHGSHKWFPGDFENDHTTYGEGVLVGYRWLDAHGLEPLWPFGYGLSYTSFKIENASVEGQVARMGWDTTAVVCFQISNTGTVAGSEVVQLYVSPSKKIEEMGRPAAPRSLAAFSKVFLSCGETKELKIRLSSDAFTWFDVEGKGGLDSGGKWRLDEGTYTCFIGASSRNLAATVDIVVR